MFSIANATSKRKDRRPNTKWEKLVSGEQIALVLPAYRMKLQASLARSQDHFNLALNGESIMNLERYIEGMEDEDTAEQMNNEKSVSNNKVSAQKFIVNDQ